MTSRTDGPVNSFRVGETFAPRLTTFAGVRVHEGWRLKTYDICKVGLAIDGEAYERGLELALEHLPVPPVTNVRPGLGVIIRHQTPTLLYLILCWWGRVNEMPIRTFVCEIGTEADGKGWRHAHGDESVCVWDLDVIAHERNAYVRHVLSRPDAPDLEAYLEDALEIHP